MTGLNIFDITWHDLTPFDTTLHDMSVIIVPQFHTFSHRLLGPSVTWQDFNTFSHNITPWHDYNCTSFTPVYTTCQDLAWLDRTYHLYTRLYTLHTPWYLHTTASHLIKHFHTFWHLFTLFDTFLHFSHFFTLPHTLFHTFSHYFTLFTFFHTSSYFTGFHTSSHFFTLPHTFFYIFSHTIVQGTFAAGGSRQLHGHHQAAGCLGSGSWAGSPVVWKLGKHVC